MADAIGNLFGAATNWSKENNGGGGGDAARRDNGGGSVSGGGGYKGRQTQQPFELNVQINYNKEFQAPAHWSLNGQVFVPLRREDPEFIKVKENFEKTLDKQVEIIQIERVENLQYYEKYSVYRKQTAEKLGKKMLTDVEKVLWHGTLKRFADAIANSKFDRGYAGARREKGYSSNGKGCYFATESKYSAGDGYGTADEDTGDRYIFQVSVVTGDVGAGEEGLREPPVKPGGGRYDSVVSDDNRMYVVFDDCAAYPEYLIKFRDLKL